MIRRWLKPCHATHPSAATPCVEIKARLHQASFRNAVLRAYRGRCAISHLPEPRLLDAAHIIMDADEQLGQPIVSNGLRFAAPARRTVRTAAGIDDRATAVWAIGVPVAVGPAETNKGPL